MHILFQAHQVQNIFFSCYFIRKWCIIDKIQGSIVDHKS